MPDDVGLVRNSKLLSLPGLSPFRVCAQLWVVSTFFHQLYPFSQRQSRKPIPCTTLSIGASCRGIDRFHKLLLFRDVLDLFC